MILQFETAPGNEKKATTANIPANTTRWPDAGLMLAQRRWRWANISPALGRRVVFADNLSSVLDKTRTTSTVSQDEPPWELHQQ